MKLKYLLPRLYENLFPEELLQFSLEETLATCDSCVMAPERSQGRIVYREDLKCCTFYPFMPNFLIGASFNETHVDPTSVADLRKIIQRRKYSLPIGFWLLFATNWNSINESPMSLANVRIGFALTSIEKIRIVGFGEREALFAPPSIARVVMGKWVSPFGTN